MYKCFKDYNLRTIFGFNKHFNKSDNDFLDAVLS